MADGLSVGNVSTAGGQTRLTGTSSNLDTDAIVAAAYAAKRQPAVRLEQRISTNQARATALGELRSLLGTLKDSVAGLRNPPGLLGANDNAFESKQAFLSTSSATAPADLVGVTVANKATAGSFGLEVQRLAAAHKVVARPLGGATRRWPTPGTVVPLFPARSNWGWPEVPKRRSRSTAPWTSTICGRPSTR